MWDGIPWTTRGAHCVANPASNKLVTNCTVTSTSDLVQAVYRLNNSSRSHHYLPTSSCHERKTQAFAGFSLNRLCPCKAVQNIILPPSYWHSTQHQGSSCKSVVNTMACRLLQHITVTLDCNNSKQKAPQTLHQGQMRQDIKLKRLQLLSG